MAAKTAKARSEAAVKAARTRKLRAIARKAAATRRRNVGDKTRQAVPSNQQVVDKRPRRSEEETYEYFSQPADGVVFVSHAQPDTVTPDELIQMSMDITKGEEKPPAGYDKPHREAWERLRVQIKEIETRGGTVELPFDIL